MRSDKIRVVQQVNQGVSAARNKGIELAAGEYLSLIHISGYLVQLCFVAVQHSGLAE